MTTRAETDVSHPDVQLRPMPYPYRAMMAICSDLDGTPDRNVYLEIMRFLNTTEMTSMGCGVGLEVGNSIYFDMPPGQFSYGNTDDRGREMIRAMIRSGHIDCLHSYGDSAMTRRDAGRALDELDRHGCRLEVWVDHATAPTNFGADITQGHGDERGHEAYHADLTLGHGIKYVWRGRVTSVIGQDARARLSGIYQGAHPLASARTVAKEATKRLLARCGNRRYAMHAPNRTLRASRLRDGSPVLEFMRCNPYWRGVQHGATGADLADVLTPRTLPLLVERGGCCILYTHLGKVGSREQPLGPRARAALCLLAEYHNSGKILVTTTRRLLAYRCAALEVSYSIMRHRAGWRIEARTAVGRPSLPGNGSVSDTDGLTWYVPDARNVRVVVNGCEVRSLSRNISDGAGCPSVSLPWRRLEIPVL